MYRATVATLLAAFASLGIAAGPLHLSYADLDSGGSACCLVPDSSGNVYVIGSIGRDSSSTDVSITRFDSGGKLVTSFGFGGASLDQARGAALDPQGNLVIVGQTQSTDFPLVGALITKTEPNANAAFITKVNPLTGQILFSTKLGGTAVEPGGFTVGTIANAVALDMAGNIHVAGMTNAADFPVTPDAFQKTGAGVSSFASRPYAFITKLSPQGDRLVYSTLLGGSKANCVGGSHCIGKEASTSPTAIAVDSAGTAIVGGSTNAPDFPVTAGAFQAQCHCQEYANNAFVAKINAGGTALIWSTFLGGSPYGEQFPEGTNAVKALVLGLSGNVIVAGRTDERDFPTTPSALQPAFAGSASSPIFLPQTPDGFVTELNPQGTALVSSTYLGGSGADRVNGLTVDPQGNLWLTGTTASLDFPGTPTDSPFTGSFIAELNPTRTMLSRARRLPAESTGQAITIPGNGDIWTLGMHGSLLQFTGGQINANGVVAVANSAGGDLNGSLAPGEFVSFYGTGFGAALDGVKVLFDGVAAPLIYINDNQINALVPYALSSRKTSVQVIAPTGSYTLDLFVKPAQPQVFLTNGFDAAVLNQDGSINSPSNLAAPGSIVSIFASGAGSSTRPLGFRPRRLRLVTRSSVRRPLRRSPAECTSSQLPVTTAEVHPAIAADNR